MSNRHEPDDPPGAGEYGRSVAQSVRGLFTPRRPTAETLAAVDPGELPRPSTTVHLRALPQIARTAPGWLIAEGAGPRSTVRLGLRTFVVEHPQARILLDPSAPMAVRARMPRAMPAALRRALQPPADVLSTVESLHAARLPVESLDFALPTHLHWDHVGGLIDLPGLPVRVNRTEWAFAVDGPHASSIGIEEAVRDRQADLYDLDGPPVLAFPRSHDLFGDGSVVLVDLAGHTPGSVGVLLHTQEGWVLVAGDAAWHHLQVDLCAQKSALPGVFVDQDREQTFTTLIRLHAVRGLVTVLPTHDHDLAAHWEAPAAQPAAG